VVTHRSLYDGTVEGLAHTSLPLFTVQYHPEGAPGPHDSWDLFDRFIALMESGRPFVRSARA
jgi:carbamoyl-phosphate synthase small subunit